MKDKEADKDTARMQWLIEVLRSHGGEGVVNLDASGMDVRAAIDFAIAEDGAEQINDLECDECESGGWVSVWSPSPPSFDVCPKCSNPWMHPRPR